MTALRSAPSARFLVGRSLFLAWLMFMTWLLGLAAIGLWCLLGSPPDWRHWSTAMVLLASGAYGLHSWRVMPAGELAWDGDAWWWHGAVLPEQPVHIEHRIDLQSVLLLQIRSTDATAASGARWLVLAQGAGADTASWQALRRAVYFCAGRRTQSEAVAANP